MTACIIALLFITAVVCAFVWLDVLERHVEAQRVTEFEQHAADAIAVSEEAKHFDMWAQEMQGSA